VKYSAQTLRTDDDPADEPRGAWKGRGLLIAGTFSAALVLLLAAAGLAFVAPERDHSPFTMVTTHWSAELGGQNGTALAGTIVSRLEYRSVRDWSATVLSHSLEPSYEGTTKTVKGRNHTFFDALTRHTFNRTETDETPEVPEWWLIPNLMQVLPERGFTKSAGPTAGAFLFVQREFTNMEFTNIYDRQGRQQLGRVETITRAVFDANTGLPTSIEIYHDGVLKERTTYLVVSRP